MVIPRAFSSGALSISLTSLIFAPYSPPCRAKTDKIAAVNVVFPWSTCPMVPTLT